MPMLEEKERSLDLPLERELPLVFQSRSVPSLPPLQSLLEVEKEKVDGEQEVQKNAPSPALQVPESAPESVTEAVTAMKQGMQTAGQDTSGVYADGSRWWREQGVENRGNGVVCTWTVVRGVSADGSVEWEEKFWEAADAYDFKELGAEKSGRDSAGGVWREFWQESMWQVSICCLLLVIHSCPRQNICSSIHLQSQIVTSHTVGTPIFHLSSSDLASHAY